MCFPLKLNGCGLTPVHISYMYMYTACATIMAHVHSPYIQHQLRFIRFANSPINISLFAQCTEYTSLQTIVHTLHQYSIVTTFINCLCLKSLCTSVAVSKADIYGKLEKWLLFSEVILCGIQRQTNMLKPYRDKFRWN